MENNILLYDEELLDLETQLEWKSPQSLQNFKFKAIPDEGNRTIQALELKDKKEERLSKIEVKKEL